MTLQLAARSLQSWRLLLERVEDTAEQVLYRLATGQRARAYFTDTRRDAIVTRFILDPSVAQNPEEIHHAVTSPSRRVSVMEGTASPLKDFGEEGMEGEDSGFGSGQLDVGMLSTHEDSAFEEERKRNATAALVTNIPSAATRVELVQNIVLEADTLSQIFENYSDRLKYLPFAKFDDFLKDCGAYEGDHLLAGSGDRIARRFGTAHREDPKGGAELGGVVGLHPPEFVAATVTVADELLRVVARAKGESSYVCTAAGEAKTPASRFALFVSHFIQKNLRLSSVMNVRLLLQQSSVVSVLDQYRTALEILFSTLALRTAKQSQVQAEEFSLSQHDWLKFLREVEMNDNWTSQKELALVFNNSQDVFDTTGDAQMSFSEFLEGMVALAQFRCPNPYLNAAGRIRAFIADKLLPQVKKKYTSVYPKIVAALKVER